jgi:hypothetical protein
LIDNAKTLAKIVTVLETTRPPWLPSDQWMALERQGAVVTPERAEAIRQAIKNAPEATIGKVLTQVISIFGGLIA